MADTSQYAATFDLIDADHDGQIDRAEFQTLMTALGGPEVDSTVADSMFASMDGDSDGKVNLEELSAYLGSNPA